MDDGAIIGLYWARDPEAIHQTSEKYGGYCRAVARNILPDRRDMEECVNDTWLRAWNAMPDDRPGLLAQYLGKITRNLALSRWRANHAEKRGGGELPLVLDELAECVPGPDAHRELEAAELAAAVDRFLHTLPERECDLFLRRYWFAEPIGEAARRYGVRENTARTILFRCRKKLRQYLEKEGVVMKEQERLFLAIGEVDPALVARSERPRRIHWLRYGLAVAACLMLVLAAGRVFVWKLEAPLPGVDTPPAVTPDVPPDLPADPSGGQLLLPEGGGEMGTLRLLSYAPESQSEAVDFLIYVNEEQFTIGEEMAGIGSGASIPLPETFPECGMDIVHLPGTLPGEARQAAEEALGEHDMEVTTEEMAAALPGSLYLRGSKGAEWDDEQVELWFAEDGQGGSFVLSARYFLEAEEGLGARFRDMASSFRVIDLGDTVPEWMRELYGTAWQLTEALFSDDLSKAEDLLLEGAEAEAYGENIWPYVSIISIDYTLDNGQSPTEAVVSVKHRLNQIEGESFNYLTMEMVWQEGDGS